MRSSASRPDVPHHDGPRQLVVQGLEISIYPTAHGRRHSTVTETAGRIRGGLPDVAADAGDDIAKSAASAMVRGLAREFHGIAVDVTWTSGGDSGWWNGIVSPRAAAPN